MRGNLPNCSLSRGICKSLQASSQEAKVPNLGQWQNLTNLDYAKEQASSDPYQPTMAPPQLLLRSYAEKHAGLLYPNPGGPGGPPEPPKESQNSSPPHPPRPSGQKENNCIYIYIHTEGHLMGGWFFGTPKTVEKRRKKQTHGLLYLVGYVFLLFLFWYFCFCWFSRGVLYFSSNS